jgi:hypothetical protein
MLETRLRRFVLARLTRYVGNEERQTMTNSMLLLWAIPTRFRVIGLPTSRLPGFRGPKLSRHATYFGPRIMFHR